MKTIQNKTDFINMLSLNNLGKSNHINELQTEFRNLEEDDCLILLSWCLIKAVADPCTDSSIEVNFKHELAQVMNYDNEDLHDLFAILGRVINRGLSLVDTMEAVEAA